MKMKTFDSSKFCTVPTFESTILQLQFVGNSMPQRVQHKYDKSTIMTPQTQRQTCFTRFPTGLEYQSKIVVQAGTYTVVHRMKAKMVTTVPLDDIVVSLAIDTKTSYLMYNSYARELDELGQGK